MSPLVSIILPTYERLALLREAVDSVLAQTVFDWELLVVDDGSTDGSADWVESLGDARITVVREPHTGNRSRLRNIGARRGRADLIAFLDSDDLWAPEKLAVQLAAMAAVPGRRWSCTGIRFIDENGTPAPQRAGQPYRAQSGWILEPLLNFTAAATMPTLIVHRSLFDEVGGFDESFMWREDYELELRLAARSEIHALADALTIVRHHPGRTSSSRRVADLHQGTAMVFAKVEATSSNERVRRIARRQRALQLAERARALSRDGDHRAALAAAGAAIRRAPLAVKTWRAAAGCVSRLVTRHDAVTDRSNEPAA